MRGQEKEMGAKEAEKRGQAKTGRNQGGSHGRGTHGWFNEPRRLSHSPGGARANYAAILGQEEVGRDEEMPSPSRMAGGVGGALGWGWGQGGVLNRQDGRWGPCPRLTRLLLDWGRAHCQPGMGWWEEAHLFL